ncbi:tyrosine-protein phosphatase [Nocardioides koreensis]|uniref:Tyrosine-protein phosphatase n=1 Tax=Nocardioides koreensis TaxID=433651 RepID=A0ABN2ZXU7_9ACTN
MSLPRLASLDSLRDVAGPGHRTRDGRRMRRHLVYRSGELQLDDADALALVGLGLTAIHDLRTAEEVVAHPDAVVPGATWRHFDVAGIPMDDLIDLPDEPAATALMERVYRSFVDDPASRRAFGAFLTRVSREDGPQLVHCTTGKDRTGWAAALLLAIAGVPDEVVLEDYLLTNERTRASRGRYLTMVATALGEELVPVYERVLVADEHYLRVGWAAADAAYGSLDGYLGDGLGLDDEVLARVRVRLLG